MFLNTEISDIGFCPQRPVFDSRPDHISFVLNHLALFLSVLVNLIPSMLHIHLHLHASPIRRNSGRSLTPSNKQGSFGHRGAINRKVAPISQNSDF